MKRLVLALATALLVSAPAQAQTASPSAAPPIDDVEGVLVDELVVAARLPGPAWWRVSDGDTTIYVLGIPDALPKGQAWDQTILKRRLKGAHTLITPPVYRASGNALALPVYLARFREISRRGDGLQAAIPPGLWERVVGAAARAGKNPRDYAELRPFFAGVRLAEDYRKRARLVYAEPLKSIQAAARRARVKPTPAMTEESTVDKVLKHLDRLPLAAGLQCLDAALDEVEAGDAAVRAAAGAWAAGDVPRAVRAPRSADRCWASLPGAGSSKRQSLAGQAEAVERALRKPGHGVAVLYTRSVLAREGVLARLKAKGYRVRGPGEPDGA